jgi:hypothetical protein|tara:strand:+ start:142 stop:447 length:306 start_codon:yes stop_codon:yes gene_type:complete
MPNKFHYGNGYNSVNSIAIIWSIDDVRDQLEILNEDRNINLELEDDDCMEVLQRVVENHDANYGVNWDSLYNAIEYCFEDEIQELKNERPLLRGDHDEHQK